MTPHRDVPKGRTHTSLISCYHKVPLNHVEKTPEGREFDAPVHLNNAQLNLVLHFPFLNSPKPWGAF